MRILKSVCVFILGISIYLLGMSNGAKTENKLIVMWLRRECKSNTIWNAAELIEQEAYMKNLARWQKR